MLFVLDIMQVTFVTKPIKRKRKQAMLRSTC